VPWRNCAADARGRRLPKAACNGTRQCTAPEPCAGPSQLSKLYDSLLREMDSNHRSPVKDQLVETVLFDFPAEVRECTIGSRRSQPRDWAAISAGTITCATTTTASAGDGGRLKTAALLTGDRWFESCSLQRRVQCEPDFLDQAEMRDRSVPWAMTCTASRP
jgi:hypothetical protein